MSLTPDQKRELAIQGDPEGALRDALARSRPETTTDQQRDTGDECECDQC